MAESPPIFGVAAEFATQWQIVRAAARLRESDLGRVDAFTPVPIPELSETLGIHRSSLAICGGLAAALGVVGFFGMIVYATLWSYPFLIGGRPMLSWPYYVIPSVSMGMLIGALAVTLGMLFLNRLPRLNHPAFNIDGFERATRDRYFLTVEARDEHFDPEAVARILRGFVPGPLSIQLVPR